MKRCNCCGNEKSDDEFNKSPLYLDGKRKECKSCQKIAGEKYRKENPNKGKEYYRINRERILEQERLKNLENPERNRQKAANWYENNKERALIARKEYRAKNLEAVKRKNIEWYYQQKSKKDAEQKEFQELWQGPIIPDNFKYCTKGHHVQPIEKFKTANKETGRLYCWCRDCFTQNSKELRIKNPEHYKIKEKIRGTSEKRKLERKIQRRAEKYKKWSKNYRSNPQVVLYDRLAQRIRKTIKLDKGIKSQRTFDLIGCSYEQLEQHLKSTLPKEVTWEMFIRAGDKYHIDHFVPACSFDLTNSEQQKKCFNWSNLRILPAKENLSKATQDKKLSIKNNCFSNSILSV